MDNYQEAHLFIAAIRVLQHTKGNPISIEDICSLLKLSREMGHATCRKLVKRGIIETITDPFSVKISIINHLEIEKIPQHEQESDTLRHELETFQAKKVDMDQKVENIQAELKKKKESLFADLEAKLKNEIDKP
jgi:hypothetical protein